jgi:protein O-GlcNAc transferase
MTGAHETRTADGLIEAGNRAEGQGKYREACERYQAAVEAAPDYAPAHLNLGIGLEGAGDAERALQAYERALAIDATDPLVNYNLGKLLGSRGAVERAEGLLRAALRARPGFAEAHVALADIYETRGDLAAAAAELEAALAARPHYVGALTNYASVLKKQGHLAQAAACYEKVTTLQPALADAHWNLGALVADQGRLEDAAVHFQRALAVKPDFPEAQHSLCMVAYEQGRPAEAVACLRELAARHPSFAIGHLSLGMILGSQRELEEASNSLQRAIALDPELAEAHLNLGHVHNARDQAAAALRCYQKSLSLNAESAEARWSLAMAQLRAVYETDAAALDSRSAFSRHLDELDRWIDIDAARLAASVPAVGNPPPFYLAYHEGNNRDLLQRYGALCTRVMASWLGAQRPAALAGTRRSGLVRVGVVSAHLQDHSVWNALVKGWFQQLDRTRFALEAFYLGAEFDRETQLAQSLADHFEQAHASTRSWVQVIAQRQPDVLIYPEIGMDSTTTKLASLRLAPVQVAAWGHPETSGLPTIDYYLSAEGLEPPHAAEHYTERLVLLPHLGCCYSSRRITPAPAELAGLDADPSIPLLICPGTPFKYAPRHDRAFAEIAARLGRCRFVFFTYRVPELSDKLRDRLRKLFHERGLDADEFISFVPWQSPAQFRDLMQRAHVFLDTIGFSGFNTAMEAVECGLPIVTREGRFLRGRLASGILKRLELTELVAQTEDRYVDLAVKLCREAGYRSRIQGRIEAVRQGLFDDSAPIRALEDFIASVATRPSRNLLA